MIIGIRKPVFFNQPTVKDSYMKMRECLEADGINVSKMEAVVKCFA